MQYSCVRRRTIRGAAVPLGLKNMQGKRKLLKISEW